MNTTSRGDWSRASNELCQNATLVDALQQLRQQLVDDDDYDFDDDDHMENMAAKNDQYEAIHDNDETDVEDGKPKKETTPFLTVYTTSKTTEYGTLPFKKQNQRISDVSQESSSLSSSTNEILWDETIHTVQLAIPVIGTYLLEMLPGIVSMILVGHVQSTQTKEYIDACALAVMFINLTGLSVGFGLASAMDTLCSQAYGAGEPYKMGLYLQQGILVLSVAFVMVFVVNYNATTIFLWLGQPTEVSILAGIFTQWLLPGIPFLYFYELLRKVLQAQNIAMPMFYISIIANIVNITFGYYFTYHTSLGWLGAAIARTIGNISFTVFMVWYLYCTSSWKLFWNVNIGFQWSKAYDGMKQFVLLGIPGALQLCFEWWAFEVIALLCGILPNSVLAIGANAIVLNVASMVYMFYLGISISATVRIGNALGGGYIKRAIISSRLSLGLSFLCAFLNALLIIVFRTSVPTIFTHDEEIIEYCSRLLYIVALFQIPDAINGVIQGIFRGTGRQSIGAYLNFVAYYIVGFPLGIVLAFPYQYNVEGLWIGMSFGLLVVSVVGIILILNSDWTRLATDARTRLSISVSTRSSVTKQHDHHQP